MFRKVAIALVAASMLAAPVMAQTPAATDSKPAAPSTATTTDKSAPSTTVKAKAKSSKHSRAMRNTRTVSHKSVMTVKHARHFNAGKSHKVAHATKSHKVAGTANKVVSAKSAARSSVN
jgi:alpha/beta superfamily hydrolase